MKGPDAASTSWFDECVAEVFAGGRTTLEEREEIARSWCSGRWNAHHALAAERGLLPAALIVACLVDVEHPLLVDELGRLRAATLLGCSVLAMQAVLAGVPLRPPADEPVRVEALEQA